MKNVPVILFLCFFITHVTLYCMEQPQQDGNIDYKETEKYLNDDCKNQLKNCLEKYKKSDEFTSQDMNNILEVVSFITGNENSADYIHDIKDDEQNGFFQWAIKKIDLPTTQWLIAKGNMKYHSAKECADFVTFCAEQLSPRIDGEKRDIAYAILKSIIEHYKTNTIFNSCKESYLEKMIMLQLQHRAQITHFIIEEELLTPFLNQDQSNSSSGLSDMYQKIVDLRGNTLAHIIVDQHDADELYKLMKKNYISKEAENNDKLTVHKLAFNKFRTFTQDTTLASVRSEESIKTRCCYFMLDKYFAEHKKDFDKKKDCCNNHIITKKYTLGIENKPQDLTSSSSSESSLTSSSSGEQVVTKYPLISDGEESRYGRCCPSLLNLFSSKQTDKSFSSMS